MTEGSDDTPRDADERPAAEDQPPAAPAPPDAEETPPVEAVPDAAPAPVPPAETAAPADAAEAEPVEAAGGAAPAPEPSSDTAAPPVEAVPDTAPAPEPSSDTAVPPVEAVPDTAPGPVPAAEAAAPADAAEAEPVEAAGGAAPAPPDGAMPAEAPGEPLEPEEPEDGEPQGRVFLVGAGPGDPGLLTVRGRALLERADVVVYDRLASPELLGHCRPDCERVFAGKAPGAANPLSQADINRLLVARAAAGKQVVRLKGGDPFVFGRGGEEALALVATGVPFEVVPGVSAAIAAPSYAGIPVTHRDVSSSLAVVTGHERPGREAPAVDWSVYGRQPDTLVVLMGRAGLAGVAEALIAAGRVPGTPAAMVAEASTPRQRTVVADLARIAAASDEAGLGSPAVLIVGEVVRLRQQLRWFEDRPLFGRRVVVTRTREQASEMATVLRLLGADPVELPVVRIRERPDPEDLRWCVTNIASFWWICFTSAHAVDPFFATLRERELDARTLAGTRIACVGPATARAVRAYGLLPDVVPPRANAASLVQALQPQVYAGQKVLFVRGEPAGATLVAGLERIGLEVRQVIAYEALADPDAAERARGLLEEGADAVTFASSATIGHFLAAAGDQGRRLCEQARVVCIGPMTAGAAESMGLRVDAVAPEASVAGMLTALVGLWAETEAVG